MSRVKTFHARDSLVMKSVIVYEGPSFLVTASARLQRLGCRPEVDASWTAEGLQINTLQGAAAEQSLIEAADAHLVVLPATHARTPPLRLTVWLERWAELRLIQDAAMAVIDDGTLADFMSTVSPELTQLVLRHALNLIIDEVPVAGKETENVVPIRQELELPLPLQQPRFDCAVTCDSHRGFGINE